VSDRPGEHRRFLLGQFANEDPVFAADNVPFVAPGYDNA
jgi:hypothetical protein